jgi:GAF domain-containing protein
MQMQTGRGPCMDCYRTGRGGSFPEITAERERWPQLVTAMTDAGYRSLHTVPVRLHDRILGALTLLNTHTTPLRPDDMDLAQALADSAALSLMHWATEPRHDDVTTRVQSAISAKATLDIAKGMIAAYHDVTIPQAARLLTHYAARHRTSLADTALALVNRTLDPSLILDANAPT